MRTLTYIAVGVLLASQAWPQTRELGGTGELLDGVAAVVDNGVVLKSELSERLALVMESLHEQQREMPPEERRPLPPLSVVEEQVLDQLVARLAPGGVLGLTLPNLRCWRYRLERGRWFNIVNPTHLVFFNRASITRLLGELGLVRVHRPVFWGGRPGFSTAANLAQYLVRLADAGSDLRIYAEKPASPPPGVPDNR